MNTPLGELNAFDSTVFLGPRPSAGASPRWTSTRPTTVSNRPLRKKKRCRVATNFAARKGAASHSDLTRPDQA